MNRRTLFATGAVLALGFGTMPALAESMMTKGTGMFEGRSNHETSGSVKLIEEDGRTFVELGDDFSLDGGPDPRVAFGRNGEYDPETIMGALLNLTGKQRYAVPPTWSLSDVDQVYIWCEVAGVPLGVASLK